MTSDYSSDESENSDDKGTNDNYDDAFVVRFDSLGWHVTSIEEAMPADTFNLFKI